MWLYRFMKTPHNRSFSLVRVGLAVGGMLSLGALQAAEQPELGFRDTPLLPSSKWRVHDADRPQPTVITPGTANVPGEPGLPPSDAIVLFNGKDLSQWETESGGPSGWLVDNGAMTVPPKNTKGGGTITTKQEFGDCQLHLEFREPNPPSGDGQHRGNSGVFFFGRYEVQVLDCYKNATYPDGTTGALYGQYPPLVNACRPPGEWQTYDILFTAPRFKDGNLESPGYYTILLNGVCVQNHTASIGATQHRAVAKYAPHGPTGKLSLQDHGGDAVSFRNIWVRPLKAHDEK